MLGYTQAFGSIGGMMVTGAYYLIVSHYGHRCPQVHGGHEAWRYTLMSGVIPAIPLIVDSAVPARIAGVAARRRPPAR